MFSINVTLFWNTLHLDYEVKNYYLQKIIQMELLKSRVKSAGCIQLLKFRMIEYVV